MNTLSFDEVIKLKGYLKEKGLPFVIHLCDACSGQYFRVESTGDGDIFELKAALEEFCAGYKAKVIFSADMTVFRLE